MIWGRLGSLETTKADNSQSNCRPLVGGLWLNNQVMILDFLQKLLPKDAFFKQPDLLVKKTFEVVLSVNNGAVFADGQQFEVGQRILIQEERTNRYSELWLSPALAEFLKQIDDTGMRLHTLRTRNERLYFSVFKTVPAL